MNKKVIIMAGGQGERFWPLSRFNRPKQFLSVFGEQSLLQQTVSRAQRIVNIEDIYIITGSQYVDLVKEQLPFMPAANIIVEPESKNTAPCIGLSLCYLKNEPEDTVLIIMPSDHYISNENIFLSTINEGIRVAYYENKLVTIGIKPSRPETGYGYIQLGKELQRYDKVNEVLNFTEKPSLTKALEYTQSGKYLWNSGMFIWRIDQIWKSFELLLPDLYEGLKVIAKNVGTMKEAQVLSDIFSKFPKVSIDYGIMEKAKNVVVIIGDFGWDDLGTWLALERLEETDIYNNVVKGNVILSQSANNIVINTEQGRLIALLGINGLVIIDSGDVVLVTSKDEATNLKKLVADVKSSALKDYWIS